ncbi:hypothetical protein ACWCPM_21215 [Streptomyces sp. NPDC002309]
MGAGRVDFLPLPARPGTDAVIPAAETEAIEGALSCSARYTRCELPDADGSLGLRFLEHGDDRRAFATEVLRGWGDVGTGEGRSSVPASRASS